MSQLAYFRFENTHTITQIAAELAEMSGRDQIVQYLRHVLWRGQGRRFARRAMGWRWRRQKSAGLKFELL